MKSPIFQLNQIQRIRKIIRVNPTFQKNKLPSAIEEYTKCKEGKISYDKYLNLNTCPTKFLECDQFYFTAIKIFQKIQDFQETFEKIPTYKLFSETL